MEWTAEDLSLQHSHAHDGEYYYELFLVSTSMLGIYAVMIESPVVARGFVYYRTFNEPMAGENLAASDSGAHGLNQLPIRYAFKADLSYYLIITIY